MASLGLWTFPFCSLARISPTFCSVASLPIESTSLFFLGWHLNAVGPLPPPAATTITVRWQGLPVGRRPRGTWTTLDFVQKALQHGATLLATQDGRTCTPETPGQACGSRTLPVVTQLRGGADPSLNSQTCWLRATPACCKFSSLALRIYQHSYASSQRKPRCHLCPFFWCFRRLRKFALAFILDSRPRVRRRRPVWRGLHRTSCKFADGARPIFAGPPLDYRRWTKIGFSPRLREPVPGLLRFAPSSRKQAALEGYLFLSRLFFQYEHTDGLYGSRYRRLFFWYYFVRRKDWASFSTGSGTGLHLTSSPPFSPTKEPLRSFQQQDVQPSLAHLVTKPHLLGTNAFRCAIVDSHGSNALRCCTYPSCGTCPTLLGAHTTIFLSHGFFFSVLTAGVGPLTV